MARLDEGRGIDMTGTVKLSSLVTDAVDDLYLRSTRTVPFAACRFPSNRRAI